MQHSFLTKALNKLDLEDSYINKSSYIWQTNGQHYGKRFDISDIKNKTKESFLTTLIQSNTESFNQNNKERNKRNTKK